MTYCGSFPQFELFFNCVVFNSALVLKKPETPARLRFELNPGLADHRRL